MRAAAGLLRRTRAVRIVGAVRRAKHSFRDVTGGAITAASQQAADLVDHAVIEVLRDTREAQRAIDEVLESDPTCAMALVMKGLHSSLLLGPALPRQEVRRILSMLEASAVAGSLSKREGLMAAALLRSVHGDLATAANLFETVMLDHPDDMVSMKYMQQAYYLLGDAHNMFGSAARHSRFFDDGHVLHGHGLGLFALGAARGGNPQVAEEFAERALSLTMKQDPAAKVALAHVMLVNGRTSEGLSHLKQMADIWTKTEGFWELTFMQGMLNCQTGRYRASERALDDLITQLAELPTTHPRALCLATALLWTLHMDSQISRTSETVNTGRYFEEMATLWEPLVGTTMHSLVFAHMLMCLGGQPDLPTVPADYRSSDMLIRPSHSEDAQPDVSCETLQHITPELKFAQFSPVEHARSLVGLQQAILDVTAGRNSDAADTLLGIQHTLHHVGGSSVEHWVWRGLLCDSLLLSKRHSEARLVLSEWIARVPTQAQFWSRFAHALKGCGLDTPSEHASFTANQLGIGQHGHGAH